GADTNIWIPLGTVRATLPTSLFFGFAVSSRTANNLATGQFRDFGAASGGIISSATLPFEPLGPSRRTGPIAFTEIMYKPATNPLSRVLDFIELYNSNPYAEDISGYRISGDVDYVFPPG